MLTESVPLLETNGVAEVIQHYINSKCVTKFLKQFLKKFIVVIVKVVIGIEEQSEAKLQNYNNRNTNVWKELNYKPNVLERLLQLGLQVKH